MMLQDKAVVYIRNKIGHSFGKTCRHLEIQNILKNREKIEKSKYSNISNTPLAPLSGQHFEVECLENFDRKFGFGKTEKRL